MSPTDLGSTDAVVINEGGREAAKTATRWEAIKSFHRAPCLAPSVGMGAVGGLGIGGLRYLGGSGGSAAFTWGSIVAGLLAGTSWFTCRRQMYSQIREDTSLLQRVAAKDPEALEQYHRKLEARSLEARTGR
mmetsp:Transcript_53442/g.106293  ORF Transcript_53442/g.106293 Transcript_53442/m.106293 type:complete len:132 (-) Transcript_53442:232-627(-)|eukprot:CAMPEP_0174738968 /NCGR_PEP_ID=MMETSP1094-20130205/70786_1 /TAXON_ID=156173 /ORGANISM="Chrysochromulina brevifilum, Strain UTEX LB 985" /LENGTH=131 /DNA_ID=CAMNT_0015942473 /DNA_START=113 /DNA_END=508 /DNA_ORIENTATION=+